MGQILQVFMKIGKGVTGQAKVRKSTIRHILRSMKKKSSREDSDKSTHFGHNLRRVLPIPILKVNEHMGHVS